MLLMNSSVLCIWNNFKLMITFWSVILPSKNSRLSIFGFFVTVLKMLHMHFCYLDYKCFQSPPYGREVLSFFFSMIASKFFHYLLSTAGSLCCVSVDSLYLFVVYIASWIWKVKLLIWDVAGSISEVLLYPLPYHGRFFLELSVVHRDTMFDADSQVSCSAHIF